MRIRKRGGPAALLALFLAFFFLLSQAPAGAQEDVASLSREADRLTYEILELKARLRTADAESADLNEEITRLDIEISASQSEIDKLAIELEECRRAYGQSLRSMYKRGEVSELEVILEAVELEEMWEDTAYMDRIVRSEVDSLERLKGKIGELDLKRRDLRDRQAKRVRMAETLDTGSLQESIDALQARLSEVNASLRAMNAGGSGGSRPPPQPPAQGWTVPAPGRLLQRVPTMPPLSDFERTGIVYSGYTTSYGEDFHGNPTASGVIYNMYDFTCAHPALPFGTWLLVTFRGSQTIVQVNDRGPFVPGRVLDLSFASAQSIGLDGVQWTEFEILVPKGG